VRSLCEHLAERRSTGLNMRAITGYCFVVFEATGVLFGGALLLLGAG